MLLPILDYLSLHDEGGGRMGTPPCLLSEEIRKKPNHHDTRAGGPFLPPNQMRPDRPVLVLLERVILSVCLSISEQCQ